MDFIEAIKLPDSGCVVISEKRCFFMVPYLECGVSGPKRSSFHFNSWNLDISLSSRGYPVQVGK
jgi:hypothetical protein